MSLPRVCLCLLLTGCGSQSSSSSDAGAPDAAVELDGGSLDLSIVANDMGATPIDLASADLSPRLVEGKVVDDLDAPVVGFKVAIGAAIAMTDAAGQFSMTAPGGAYDVLVAGVAEAMQQSPGKTRVAQFVELTRSDPVLHIGALSVAVANDRSATYSGTLSGIATPPAADIHGIVALDADSASLSRAYFSNQQNSVDYTQIPAT